MHPYMMAPAIRGFHRNKPFLCGTVAMVAPYGSTGEDCNLSVGVWLLTDDSRHSLLVDLEDFVPDDLGLALRRLAGVGIADPVLSCLPCWGVHSRAGHRQSWGHFTALGGSMMRCVLPAVAEDEHHLAATERVEILQMGGPCFYDFQIVEEQRVRDHAAARRRRRPETGAPVESAPESLPIDWSQPCQECADRIAAGTTSPHAMSECPELPF